MWNTGLQPNPLIFQKTFHDCGRTRPRPTCTTSKRCLELCPHSNADMLKSLVQSKSVPTCITLSPDSSSFVTISLPDRQIRVFNFLSGKITRKYDESLATVQEMQQAGTTIYKVDDMEFGRRLAVERELELPGPDGKIPGMWMNAVWDESGCFIIYPTLLGTKSKRYSNLSELRRLTCCNHSSSEHGVQ